MAKTDILRRLGEAEAAAGALPALQIAALKVAATVAQGVHGRRRVGVGDSFWQYRRYQPGDPLRRVDWRRSAKSHELFVRELEWEAVHSVWMWRDGSPSMAWSSSKALPQKRERAELLLLALAALLERGGEHIGLLGGPSPLGGPTALERLARALQEESSDSDLPPPQRLPRHAQVVWFSDFLDPLPALRAAVAEMAERGVVGHLVHILDPAEADLPFAGRVRFDGLEGEASELVPRVETIRDAYRRKLAELQDGLAEITRRAGWSLLLHRTDRPPETALLALYGRLGGATGRGA
ncbi:MAG TPA: DUF58 domain-containing protein [Alphaproteobacteria bacterium]|nr:DUF58 domain-containing protein [Alphaproteobacteria bacterium]